MAFGGGSPEVHLTFRVCQRDGLSRGCDLYSGEQGAYHVGLADIAGIRIQEVHHVHLATLGGDNPRREHARVHANVCGQWREGDRGHRGQILEIEHHDERIEHVTSRRLFQRRAACDDEVLLHVHVVNEGGMRPPLVDHGELDGVEKVYVTITSGCADVSALFHLDVVVCGGNLGRSDSVPVRGRGWERPVGRAYSLDDFSFVDVHHKHGVLQAGDEDLRSGFRGEAHTPKVPHLFIAVARHTSAS